MQRIYLVRHGQTQWNKEHRMQGRKDSPLTELGLSQAAGARDELADIDFDRAYCSPAYRAVNTAEIILQPHDMQATVCDDFAEIALGEWEGDTYRGGAGVDNTERDNFWHHPHRYTPSRHGGESFTQVRDRALCALRKIMQENEQDVNLLVVAHTVTIRSVVNHFLKRDLAAFWHDPVMPPCSVSILECSLENDQLSAEVIAYAGTDCSAGCR